jgi:hypothetical protein
MLLCSILLLTLVAKCRQTPRRWYRWQICHWYQTTPVVNENLRKDVTTGVNDTGGAPCVANISANVWKNSK